MRTRMVYTCTFEPEMKYRERLLETGRDSDCEFLVGNPGKLVKGHRVFLEPCSPHFAELLGKASDSPSIRLPHIKMPVFMMMLRGIYTYHIELNDVEFALALAEAAKEFQLLSIYSHCISYMSNSKGINEESVFSLLEVDMLRDDCWSLICSNTRAVLESRAFLDAKPETVAEIFARDDLVIANELDLVEALWRYAKHNEALPDYSCEEVGNKIAFDKFVLPALCNIRFLTLDAGDVFRNLSVQTLVPPAVITAIGANTICPEESFYKHLYPENFSRNSNPRDSGFSMVDLSQTHSNILLQHPSSTPNQSSLPNGIVPTHMMNGNVSLPP